VREADDAAVLEGERKTITALFADIKGSTELMEDLDPEDARRVIDPALNLMIDAAHRYDGYVVQSTGDGIFALFGAPVAHEDHPQRALLAALRMQQEIKKQAASLRAEGRAPIQIRIGLNTGEVVVRPIQTGDQHIEYTPIGHTANLASRMQTLAEPGSVVASEAIFRLCDGYFLFRALGPSRIKGVNEPVNVYEVTGLGSLRTRLQRSAGRGLSKFVGREREMSAMRHALELAKKGHGQIVAAMGEAGLGKSRLLYEFKMTSQSGCLTLETFSVSHGQASAYLPVIELLNNYFEIEADDDPRKRREKMAGKVMMLDRALEDSLPYLFALLGVEETAGALAQMDGQVRQRRTLEAIKRILLRESLNQPLIVVFEDLHWIGQRDPGAARPVGGRDCQCARAVAGELSASVPAQLEQQEPLRAASLGSAGARERRGNADGIARRQRRAAAVAPPDNRQDRGQPLLHGRDGAGAVRRRRAGAQRDRHADQAAG
jgi:class 3 adenylate cyclase